MLVNGELEWMKEETVVGYFKPLSYNRTRIGLSIVCVGVLDRARVFWI
jgi:hypothetical protein